MNYRFDSFGARTGLALAAAFTLSCATSPIRAADKIDFAQDIKPLLESACLSCHSAAKHEGGLVLVTKADAFKGGEKGVVIVPGKPSESRLYTSTILPAKHEDLMPPKGAPLNQWQTDKLRQWIEEGAAWPDDMTLTQVRRIDFVKDVQPLLEFNCVACHREGYFKSGLRLDTRELAFQGGDGGPGIIPGRPKSSPVYTSTAVAPDDEKLMPPAKKNGPLPKDQIELLASWIQQGANWPEGITLTQKKIEEASGDDLAAVTAIHKKIMANLKAKSEADMKPYTNSIPGTTTTYAMVAIPGGEFLLGTPESEPHRKPDEGPQRQIKISPFWMGQYEVTWDEYEMFMYPDQEKALIFDTNNPYLDKVSDAVSRPTKPYVEMSFGMGKPGYPAISMTQHAANKYCQWLSARTGEYYRLPTEAEWEYACRAGTTTAYSFGDDASKLAEYAWYDKNSDFKYQKVGRKKPNPWGLYDMHGNVMEWCLDQYDEKTYEKLGGSAVDPWVRSTTPYPHVARGGSWYDEDPALLRSGARRASDKSWKIQDPQLPKSIWYLTDAQFLGFRLVRPLKVPPPEDLLKIWNNGVERE